jgi:hypothetical protein
MITLQPGHILTGAFFNEAMRHSLENRARRLDDGLQRAHELARQASPTFPDPEELEEMEESDRERFERLIEAVTLTGNTDQIRDEISELRQLAQRAREVEAGGAEAKLTRLQVLLQRASRGTK